MYLVEFPAEQVTSYERRDRVIVDIQTIFVSCTISAWGNPVSPH